MKTLFEKTETSPCLAASLFILAFVLLMFVYRIWHIEQLYLTWKMIALGAYLIGFLKVFNPRQRIRFMGYCIMIVGLKCMWGNSGIHVIWKVIAVIAVVIQVYPFIKWNIHTLSKRKR